MTEERKKRILNVDDHDAGRYAVSRVLSLAGFEVIEAANGADALRLAAESPDLVLLDVHLPDFSGFEVCRRIKADPGTASIPVVHLSAVEIRSEQRSKGLEGGADGYLVGPVEPRELVATVQAYLRISEIERRSRREAEYWQKIFDSIRDGICLLDGQGRVVRSNAAFAALVGRSDSEITGRSCWDFVGGTTVPFESWPFARAAKSLRRESLEMEAGGKWLQISADPILDESGTLVSAIHIVSDITERRNLEAQVRQMQKMESVGTLAGGIAHDFNNILGAVVGYGHVALMTMSPDDPQRENINHILEAAGRAVEVTKGILLFSRKQVSTRKAVDLNEVIAKVDDLLKRTLGEDVECRTVLQEKPLAVLADRHQLEQALVNLATNARDAMPGGGVFTVAAQPFSMDEAFVAAHGYGRPGAYALITVSDTGSGMDQATQQRIFEPFFTTKEVGKGTGLGLSVVYGILKQHGGFVNVYSEPGHGTTFRISLPLVAETTEETQRTPEWEPAARGTETILVAEDDETLRVLTGKILTDHGYDVVLAVDGEDAVRKFREHRDRIHLLLFDLVMPKANGKEACEEIKRDRPDVKAIFVSGYAPNVIQQKIALAREAAVVFKPLSPDELLRKVREVLEEKG